MMAPLLLAMTTARAADASGSHAAQQVIKLPLRINKPEAAPAAPRPAEGGKTEAGKTEAAKAAPVQAKPMPAPEAMAPTVQMAKPPRDLSQPSPEVHAPGAAARPEHRARRKTAKAKAAHGAAKPMGEASQVKAVVSGILKANGAYVAKHSAGYLAKLGERAAPKATVVTCSSPGGRVGMQDGDADADLFVISNMGNQLATSEGSVEYGVRHLHTPLLMFVSHTGCGAIKAAASDYSNMEPSIQKELDNIEIPKGIDATNGALININNQVEGAILKFSGEVEAGKLAVLGGYYDYNNDLKQGRGKLVITNINGETDPGRIRALTRGGKYFHYGFMGQ
ncbi:carbonic anhydrase [Chromobacterium alticapitis]|uniref:Carbonic anhydrase n=1 Tax=Chromobacterium alticapitis TaxID=2073169 RepID=A0A2S5DIB6_9NEIS|nr:carbonic anhydrase [Chromobacterium alticapitis]POZ62784.1 hypothetical protein C2I19_06965 [Chromobacterium alticapitis]